MDRTSIDRRRAYALVKRLRSSPEQYSRFRAELLEAEHDRQRRRLLSDLAISEEALICLVAETHSGPGVEARARARLAAIRQAMIPDSVI